MRKPKQQKQQKPIFSNKQFEMLLRGITKNHMDLVKYLYDNHIAVLREYEKSRGRLNIHFLIDKRKEKKWKK